MAALCVLLTAACWCDYRKKKIPNVLIVTMLICGIGWRLLLEGAAGLPACLGQIAIVVILFYGLFRVGVAGAGDVKLIGVTAGFLPFKKIFLFLFVSLLIAAIISLIKLWKHNNIKERLRHFASYLADGLNNGWKLYPKSGLELPEAGICLSGPILISLLLHLGGAY